MKRFFEFLIIIACLLQSTALANDWRAKDVLYKFDFSAFPEYKALNGEWEVKNVKPKNSAKYTFDIDSGDFSPISGEWSVSDGKYLQSAVGVSSTTRSMLSDTYENFSLSFDITPHSEENTVMIYFGCGKDKTNSAEINSYQSKLIINGEEFAAGGSILKDESYNISLEVSQGVITLFENGEALISKNIPDFKKGTVGIGTWNSSILFDNFEIAEMSELGNGKILTGAKNSSLIFPELESGSFMIASEITSENIYGGSIGMIICADENGNGYYIGINKNSVFLKKKIDEKTKLIKKADFKPRSKKVYKLTAVCDGEHIGVFADDAELISATAETSGGMCGFFSDDTDIEIKSVLMQRLENISPPVCSDGNTSYYIDAENGNDFNDGKTPETAWRTLDKAEQSSFADGDKILLKRGQSFEGTLTLENISGDFELSAYGDGDRPKIIACESGIVIKSCRDIKISDIELDLRIYKGTGYGIYSENSDSVTIVNSLLKCNTFGGNTFAADGSDITFDNTVCEGFGINVPTFSGAEISNDSAEIKGHWAYSYMKKLKNDGIITEYRPDDIVTRAEFASMLVSALALEPSEYRGIFADVTAEDWFASRLQTVSDYRLLPSEMTPKREAAPNSGLLREEAAAIAALACSADDFSECEFSDIAEAEQWSEKYIYAALNAQIMNGKGDGKFYPKATVTRAEAAVILTKLTERDIKL